MKRQHQLFKEFKELQKVLSLCYTSGIFPLSYGQNRFKALYQNWFDGKPDIKYLEVFGLPAYMYIPENNKTSGKKEVEN